MSKTIRKYPMRSYFTVCVLILALASGTWFAAFGDITDALRPIGDGVATGVVSDAVTDYSKLTGGVGATLRIPYNTGAGNNLTTNANFLFDDTAAASTSGRLFTVSGGALIGNGQTMLFDNWGSGSEYDNLLVGTIAGNVIGASNNAHLVVELNGDDSNDVFGILIDTTGNDVVDEIAFVVNALTGHVSINNGDQDPTRALEVTDDGSNVVASFTSTDADAFVSFQDNTTTDDFEVAVGARGNALVLFTSNNDTVIIDGQNDPEMRLIPNAGSFVIRAEREGPSGDGPGPDLVYQAAVGVGTNQKGGDVILLPGLATGTGIDGGVEITGNLTMNQEGSNIYEIIDGNSSPFGIVIRQPAEGDPVMTMKTTDSGAVEDIEWFQEQRFFETTNATVTSIWSRIISTNTTIVVEATVVGFRDVAEGDDARMEKITAMFRRGTGNLVLSGSSEVAIDDGTTGWNVSAAVGGATTALINIQGAASQDVDWKIHVRFMEVVNP